MSNYAPNQPENITSYSRPSNRLRPLGQAPSAVIKTISNIAKAATMYLAALTATTTVSQAQTAKQSANYTIEQAYRPDNTVKLTTGYILDTETTNLDLRVFFFAPNNTDKPYNSIVGGSYRMDFFTDQSIGLMLEGENISLTPAFRLPGFKGQDLNMFNVLAIRGSIKYMTVYYGLAHLNPTEFRNLDTTILTPFMGAVWEPNKHLSLFAKVAPLYDNVTYSSDDLNLNRWNVGGFFRVSAGATVDINDFSLSALWLSAHNGNPNHIDAKTPDSIVLMHSSFMFTLSFEPGRSQAAAHTTRYSVGYNHDHPVTGSGPTFEAIAVHRPASLQSEETQNTNVAGSLQTLKDSCSAINIAQDSTLDITSWDNDSFDNQKLKQHLDCQEISSFTLDLSQLDKFNQATQGRTGFKLTLKNSQMLRETALAKALLKIPAITTADIKFQFYIDRSAKLKTLKDAHTNHFYHLSSHPEISKNTQ